MVMAPNGAQGKVARPRLKAVGTGNACATASRSAPKTPRRTTAPSEQYIMGLYYISNKTYDPATGLVNTHHSMSDRVLNPVQLAPDDKPYDDPEDTPPAPRKRGKCCCVESLDVLPKKLSDTPSPEGGKTISDYFPEVAAAGAAGVWGDDGRLGADRGELEGTKVLVFKFQVIGKVTWKDWSKSETADCEFLQWIDVQDSRDGNWSGFDDEKAGRDTNTDVGKTSRSLKNSF